LTSIEGPVGIGPVNSHFHFYIEFEFNPGEPFQYKKGRCTVRLKDTEANSIAMGQVDQPRFRDIAIPRVAYFATLKLQTILASPLPDMNQVISPSFDELKALMEVDPKRVEYDQWIEIPEVIDRPRQSVFVSCGQKTSEEVELGERISNLIQERTGLKTYFAEEQSSLEGVTQHIYQAIYDSAGFIAVMHRRDKLSPSKELFRGSLWVEQEIAIASFIVQVLGISLPSRAYLQKGVQREGVRNAIIFNPIEFETFEEVINDLEEWWPILVP
jgi:hypothetical protein